MEFRYCLEFVFWDLGFWLHIRCGKPYLRESVTATKMITQQLFILILTANS